MKKNLFFLCALICSVSLFSACSDDDEDTTWQNIPDSTEANTTLKINGATLAEASAAIKLQSAEAGVLTLTKAVYGHDKIDVPVVLAKSNDSTYVYEGTTNIDGNISKAEAAVDKGLTVTAKGTVTTSGKLTADVTTSGWGTLSGVYSGDSLKMTTNGTDNNLNPVTVTATSAEKATLTFTKIPNVALDLSMEVNITSDDAKNFKFEGTAEKEAGYNVYASGTIANGVLTVAITTDGYATLNSIFFDIDSNFDCTYNGEALSAGFINFNFKSENAVDILFNGLIPGIFYLDENGNSDVKVTDVAYTKATDSETYSFSGTFAPKGFTKSISIAFEGTISPEKKLTLALTRTTNSDIVGKWSMSTTAEGMGETFIDFQSATGQVTIPDSIYNFVPENLKAQVPQTFSDEAFKAGLSQILGQYTTYLKSIEFTTGGDVKVVYSKVNEGSKEYTLEGYMYYSVTDNGRLLITPSLDKLLGGLMSTNSSLKAYDPWDASYLLSGDGIPFNYSISGGKLLVTLDNGVTVGATTFVAQMLPLLGMLAPMLPPAVQEMIPMLNVLVPGINGMFSEIPTLEIGIYLKK